MTSFTLVHGSTQNSRGWDHVAALLRAEGHEVVTPDLPKRGADLRTYGELITSHIPRNEPRVVVLHSFAGAFAPHLRRVDVIVFVGAFIPEPERSALDQIRSDDVFTPEWMAAGPRWRDPSQHEALAREFLFHDCDEETIRWALGTIELVDTSRIAIEPNPFDAWPPARLVSIVCTQDRTVRPEWQRKKAREIAADVIEVDAGHCPHVSRAGEVARVLMRS